MLYENENQTNYNNSYPAAMGSSSNPSSIANPYYYPSITTISPDDTPFYELDEYAPSDCLTFPTGSEVPCKRPKRKQVKNACVNCQKACKRCDDGRPCQRCIKLGLTETCMNSPRKERRKGMKRGPYKKRQYVSTSVCEEDDSQQPMSATTASASDWEEQKQAAYAAAVVAAPSVPKPIITPPLSQQDLPLRNSPLSSDVGYYGYTPGAAAAPDCASCSSPLSPDFPVAGWNDPYLLGTMAPPPSSNHYRYHQTNEPIVVKTLPITCYEEQYPTIMPAEPTECYYYNKPSHQQQQQQQQHTYYPSRELVCTSYVQPPPLHSPEPQMTSSLVHPHQHQQYPYPQDQPQQNGGYWQSFLSAN